MVRCEGRGKLCFLKKPEIRSSYLSRTKNRIKKYFFVLKISRSTLKEKKITSFEKKTQKNNLKLGRLKMWTVHNISLKSNFPCSRKRMAILTVEIPKSLNNVWGVYYVNIMLKNAVGSISKTSIPYFN